MSEPRFSWEPAQAGSLLLKVTDGDRETVWKIRKGAKVADVQRAFEEMVGTLAQRHITGEPWRADYNPYEDKSSVWLSDAPVLSEADSLSALADKAAKAQAGAWFSAKDNDMSELPMMIPKGQKEE